MFNFSKSKAFFSIKLTQLHSKHMLVCKVLKACRVENVQFGGLKLSLKGLKGVLLGKIMVKI